MELFKANSSWVGIQRLAADGSLLPLDCQRSAPGFTLRQHVRRHLAGEARLSLYAMPTGGRSKGRTRFGVVDLDGDRDRLKDAEALLAGLLELGLTGYLARSWTQGHFHVLIFFRAWEHGQKVARVLDRLCRRIGIRDYEVRPSGGGFLASTDGPAQQAIALPYFGDGSPKGDRCRVIHPDFLSPIDLETFLQSAEPNGPPPEIPDPSPNPRIERALAWTPAGSKPTPEALVDSWPLCSEGKATTAPNAKEKAGRNALTLSLAGKLALDHGLVGDAAMPHLRHFNERLSPPLPERELRTICRSAERYHRAKGTHKEGTNAVQ